MQIDARILKSALWSVWLPIAGINPPGLRLALQTQATLTSQILAGGPIQRIVANGQEVQLAATGFGLDYKTLNAMWVYLVDEYDRATTELGYVVPDTTHDTAIEIQMEANLRPITGYTDNWMWLPK